MSNDFDGPPGVTGSDDTLQFWGEPSLIDTAYIGAVDCSPEIKNQKAWDYNEKIRDRIESMSDILMIGYLNDTHHGISTPGILACNEELTIGGPDCEIKVSRDKVVFNGVDLLDEITQLKEFNEVLIRYLEASGSPIGFKK